MAYPGGIVPYERGGHGQGFVRVRPPWTGKVRVGPGIPPTPRRPAAARRRGAIGTPPPGLYDPARKYAIEEGAEGLGNLEGEAASTRERGEHDYATSLGQITQREGQRRSALQKTLEAVQRSYAALGAQQQEGANRAGVLQGGALIQSAAKRSANEGKGRTEAQEATARALDADREDRELLAREWAPPEGGTATPLGTITGGAGRYIVDLASHLRTAQKTQAEFQRRQEEAEGYEAGKAGWEPQPAVTATRRQGRSRSRRRRR